MGITTLIISNEEMNDIIKTVKSLKNAGLLIKDVSETIKKKQKSQKGVFFGILLGTSGANFLDHLLIRKRVMRADKCTIRAGEETIRAGQDF